MKLAITNDNDTFVKGFYGIFQIQKSTENNGMNTHETIIQT